MKNRYRMPAAVLLVVLTLEPLSVHAAPPADQDRTSAGRGAISSTNAAVHAIQSREPGRLSHQLAKGLDPNSRGILDMPLVSFAAMKGDDQAVRELVAAGADVNLADVRGITPLMWAAHSRSLATVRILIRAGADPRA